MTDPTPTPTRAEVEALALKCTQASIALKIVKDFPSGQAILMQAADMIQALRERAEAAEKERDEARAAYLAHKRLRIDAEQQAHQARRAEAAAWNDAIEAAAEKCDVASMDHIGDIVRGIGEDIRALRRAAPTEGEA